MEDTTEEKSARNYLVSGRVQGVCYRMATVEQARRLGLTGWVRNLADGRVEVYACGSRAALDTLQAWLHQGPPMARVDSVGVSDSKPDKLQEFSIRH